ncbi:MAG: helix-turn-helix domain-containing protein [Pseudomonadota bacterium]|jgi:excisionase family DNA binding protein
MRGKSVRGIKRHRNYTVEEAARALGVSKLTVRRMKKAGLPAITNRKPHLIMGADLVDFLIARRAKRAICQLSECFCFTCRKPREALGNLADLHVRSAKIGNLEAFCIACGGPMRKAVSLARLDELKRLFDLSVRQVGKRMGE